MAVNLSFLIPISLFFFFVFLDILILIRRKNWQVHLNVMLKRHELILVHSSVVVVVAVVVVVVVIVDQQVDQSLQNSLIHVVYQKNL